MSRALDPETAALLKQGNPLAAYEAISDVLVAPGDGLLEIEILGKSHPFEAGEYVVRDGRAVGISKLGLVQAFTVARQELKDHLDGLYPPNAYNVFRATTVILLFDPEHLTAANARKRRIHADRFASTLASLETLRAEKRFVDSLLTSRLHRHTKSPVLWSHRRWLLTMFASRKMAVDVLDDLRSVVFVAGERHPRNYYAWCHARFLIGLKTSVSLADILAAVQGWCFQHHTDISGWSFLSFLLDAENGPRTGGCSTFAEVLDLVDSLRLANESVWVFLRTLAASRVVGDEQHSRFLAVQAAVLGTAKTPADQAVLRAAVDWCETYRDKGVRLAGA
jgi:hypothetical protein